jgi:hypothetical protein
MELFKKKMLRISLMNLVQIEIKTKKINENANKQQNEKIEIFRNI